VLGILWVGFCGVRLLGLGSPFFVSRFLVAFDLFGAGLCLFKRVVGCLGAVSWLLFCECLLSCGVDKAHDCLVDFWKPSRLGGLMFVQGGLMLVLERFSDCC
jgi:hypothetical protein